MVDDRVTSRDDQSARPELLDATIPGWSESGLLLDQDEEAQGRDRSDATMSGPAMTGDPAASTLAGVACPMVGEALTNAISAAIAGLYRQFYGHDRTTATTYLNDNVVLCVLDILTTSESRLVTFGCSQEVIDGRISFQSNTQDAFTAAVEIAGAVPSAGAGR